MTVQCIIAVDPGREKCGVAVVDRQQGTLWQQVVPSDELLPAVTTLVREFDCRAVALGNQTSSAAAAQKLQPLLDQNKIEEIFMIDEHGSTEKARQRYWKAHPPTGWRRFIPIGLLLPPCAIDDFAAIILGERFLGKNI